MGRIMGPQEAGIYRFAESFGFIISFLVACLGVSIFLGEQILFVFLLLILAGMLTVNVDKITSLLGRVNNV